MDKLRYYEMGREVPQDAQKDITAGRLKGMTDINPMWRIKKLTEMYGPCGEGWYYVPTNREFVPGSGGQIAVFVDIMLYYRKEDNTWSEGIPGTGGASYVTQESKGLYTDDEAVKKATTDALGVACKALGIGADVYWDKDRSKYPTGKQEPPAGKTPPPKQPVQQQAPLISAGQIKFIRECCTDDDIAALLDKYRIQRLEDMPRRNASVIIAKLQERMG